MQLIDLINDFFLFSLLLFTPFYMYTLIFVVFSGEVLLNVLRYQLTY